LADRCDLALVTSAAQWAALFAQVDAPHLVQSWAYGEAKQAAGAWRARRFVFERDGEPVAICQVLDKSVAGIRWATRLNRGPLFLGGDPPSDDTIDDVYRTLRARWRHLRGVLVLAPALPVGEENHHLVSEAGFRERNRHGWCSARLDLRLDEAQLRKNLTAQWRNRLKVAERSDLELRVSQTPNDVEWIVERHVENMKEKDFVGPAPGFLRALYSAAPDEFLVFQARLGPEPVGGMAVCRFGGAAECYVGWFGPEGRTVNVGNFLYWQVALELQRRGCRYLDLGGFVLSDKHGHFNRFKAGLRGAEYQLLNEWLAF
jgi:Acetyltransferase (GNAT) domain